jgi:hypothetical protein
MQAPLLSYANLNRGQIMKPGLSAGKELLFANRPATRLSDFDDYLGGSHAESRQPAHRDGNSYSSSRFLHQASVGCKSIHD